MRAGVYVVPTDRWYIERTVWLIAGCVLVGSVTLSLAVHPLWIVLVTATGLASIGVSLNGFCLVGNILKPLDFKGLLDANASQPGAFYIMRHDS